MKFVSAKGLGVTMAALAFLGMQGPVMADENSRRARSFKASLTGFEEPPSISSTGRGRVELTVNRDEDSIDYELSFSGLEGTVLQAHVHIAQPGVNGGIAFWLCGTTANPGPAGTPDCGGPNEGGASGTVEAANIVGPAGQGIAPGEFAEVLRAIRAGYAYANVHSTRNPPGEIRGQVQRGDGKHDR